MAELMRHQTRQARVTGAVIIAPHHKDKSMPRQAVNVAEPGAQTAPYRRVTDNCPA